MNEADTCRRLVRPKLEEAGWDDSPYAYSEQTSFTDGRIIVPGGNPRRLKKKFTDFLLRYTRDVTLAVVEAKSDRKPAGNGSNKTGTTPKRKKRLKGVKKRLLGLFFCNLTPFPPQAVHQLQTLLYAA
jgi:type I site-specific restriction endonuclease